VKLSWYTAGLIWISVTIIGIIALINKKPYRNQMFFLSVFGIFAVYQILSSNISPDQPWWIRRYLPVVIPSMIICMGCGIAGLCSHCLFNGKHRTLRCGIAYTLLLLIILPQGISDTAIVFHKEYNDAIGDIRNIANELNPDGVIVFTRNYYTDKIILPLHYVQNRTTVPYNPSSASILTLLNWVDSGKTLYLVDAPETEDIIIYPQSDNFTYQIRWTTLHGMSIDNYYNYIIIPHQARVELHTLSIITFNKTKI
jgi:hypothetical protein